jgi:hypothetical protein
MLRALVERGWHVTLPSVVLAECLTGHAGRDASANRVLSAVGAAHACEESHARAAAALRFRSRNPSVVDALVAELAARTGGEVAVLTSDAGDLARLLDGAPRVRVLACGGPSFAPTGREASARARAASPAAQR